MQQVLDVKLRIVSVTPVFCKCHLLGLVVDLPPYAHRLVRTLVCSRACLPVLHCFVKYVLWIHDAIDKWVGRADRWLESEPCHAFPRRKLCGLVFMVHVALVFPPGSLGGWHDHTCDLAKRDVSALNRFGSISLRAELQRLITDTK